MMRAGGSYILQLATSPTSRHITLYLERVSRRNTTSYHTQCLNLCQRIRNKYRTVKVGEPTKEIIHVEG